MRGGYILLIDFLNGRFFIWIALAAFAVLICASTGPALAAGGKGAFSTRQAFDAMNLLYNNAHKYSDNENGNLAWGASYAMMAYAYMYEATQDIKYLDILGSFADAVLANRDNVKGKADYRGLSLPGWGAAGSYSIGCIDLLDTAGKPTLSVSTAYTGSNDKTQVQVQAGSAAGLFNLVIQNSANNLPATVFRDVSMDPSQANYVVSVVGKSSLAGPYSAARLKVRGLGSPTPLPQRQPAPMHGFMEVPRYLWPVHQGMITFPIITYARFVYENPALRENAGYKSKADAYIQAVETLMELLEPEWRQNDQGEGWYIVAPEAPVWMDGVDEPFNHFLAVGRTMVQLAAVTGSTKWREKAERMARTFRNDLRLTADGAYTWSYWWSKGYGYKGWSPAQNISTNTPGLTGRPVAEDTSHGSIDLHFAYLCYKDGIVFDREDMLRFTRTFLGRMVTTTDNGLPTLWERVDGTGRKSAMDQQARHWVLLAEFDPRVAQFFADMYASTAWSGYVLNMLNSASMNLVRVRGQ